MVGKTNVAGARLRAVIAVTYPEGSVCTCSNGTKTLKARDASGKALFNVSTGTWTVTATDGNKTKDATVDITTEGQVESVKLSYNLYLYNQGDLCTSITGGWTKRYYSDSNPLVVDYQTKQIKYATSTTGSAAYSSGGIRPNNRIDVTGYATLNIKFNSLSISSGAGKYALVLRTSDSNDPTTGAELRAYGNTASSSPFVFKLDISSVSGEYYVFFCTDSGIEMTGYIDSIWLSD